MKQRKTIDIKGLKKLQELILNPDIPFEQNDSNWCICGLGSRMKKDGSLISEARNASKLERFASSFHWLVYSRTATYFSYKFGVPINEAHYLFGGHYTRALNPSRKTAAKAVGKLIEEYGKKNT